MDKLTNFADKMFLIKMNQLTGLDKQSTNILGKKASVYYLETTKLAWKPHHQLRLWSHNQICVWIPLTSIHTDNVMKLMKLQLVSFPSAVYRPSSWCRNMLTRIQIAGVLLKRCHLNTGAKAKPVTMAKEKWEVRSRNRRGGKGSAVQKNQLIPKCKVSLLWK